MNYSIFNQDTGKYMCDIEVKDNDSDFNKAQVNDIESDRFSYLIPVWVQNPYRICAEELEDFLEKVEDLK